MLDENDILLAYRQLLARDPESPDVIKNYLQCQNSRELYKRIASSEEFKKKVWDYQFFGYTASFDPVDTILQFVNPRKRKIPGHLVNFMGVGFPHASLPLANPPEEEALPIPANWHTDLAELGSALHVVLNCKENFTMVELGSGIGIWSNICGMAAKMRGLKVSVMGIEADKAHILTAEKTLSTNGFQKGEYKMIRAIVGNRGTKALFRKTPSSGIDWGGEPIFEDQEPLFHNSNLSGNYEEVPVFSLEYLLENFSSVDLLHVDIQGGEETLFLNQEALLNKKVKIIIIGTHTRIIEGKLSDFFRKIGWVLTAERPLIFDDKNLDKIKVDGVQYWASST